MKQVISINKKWILTASLLAVLGTQYSYQSSSRDFTSASTAKNYGEFVLASVSGDNTVAKTEDPNKKTTTEATNGADCKECKSIVLSPTNTLKLTLEEYTKLITQIKLDIAQSTPAAKTVTTSVSDSDCEIARADETRTERRDRIQCEKDEKAQAKTDKENDKKQARLDKFEDKMDALKDKCAADLECLTSGFTSIVSRYDGKDALPVSTVNKAFNNVVGIPFKKALESNDPDALVNAQSLLLDMPPQYQSLKKAVILAVKAQATVSAEKVTAEYATLNELAKQNKSQEYLEALPTVQKDHRALNNIVMGYSASIEQTLQLADDRSTFDFYQKSYVPDMKKILAGIGSAATTTTTPTTPVDDKTNTRNARSGETISENNSRSSTEAPAAEKMTRDNNSWTLPTGTQGLNIGNPQGSSRGGRGANPSQINQ